MKFNRNTLLVILSVVAIGFLVRRTVLSCYQPRPIEIEPVNEQSIHELEHNIKCTPGRVDGSTYTKALTPRWSLRVWTSREGSGQLCNCWRNRWIFNL